MVRKTVEDVFENCQIRNRRSNKNVGSKHAKASNLADDGSRVS